MLYYGGILSKKEFTKLMKPVFSDLRQQGHESSPYIDDSFLLGNDYIMRNDYNLYFTQKSQSLSPHKL